ncbi:hypothetical protein SAMN05216551_109157 [Chitinasiproducens palmae]|uniref:Uncharacterized protein n=1 Tax=Chitinasiproducens palmae TaxID=1770053 RepID=A0A1H2PS88_9BURK|nr:hypothetical protein SAMN05216551_109157 [Chitinasiproducens palmae]
MAPLALLAALLLVGMACLVAGVFILSGAGWALVAAAGCCFVIAGIVSRGIRRISGGAHA